MTEESLNYLTAYNVLEEKLVMVQILF